MKNYYQQITCFSPTEPNKEDYHDLVQQLEQLVQEKDVQQIINEQMAGRVDRVLRAYREDENNCPVLRERRIDHNQGNMTKKSFGKQGKSTQKSSLANTKSKGFIKKELLMLPKYYKEEESSGRRQNQKRSTTTSMTRSVSAKSGLTVTSQAKSKSKPKQGAFSKSKSNLQSIQSFDNKPKQIKGKKIRVKTEMISQQEENSPFEKLYREEDGYGYKQIQFLNFMKEKEEEVLAQKEGLEEKIRRIKESIQDEKLRSEEINRNITNMGNKMNNLQNNSEQVINRKGCVDKRLGDLWGEVKILKESYDSTIQQNQEVKNNLNEEKELISMYKTVIEELKSQLKIEKVERDEKKKQLRVLKKTEDACKTKFKRANWKNDGLMEKVKKSMDKWN